MKYFLLTCCVVLVSARPEGGYHYDKPTSPPSGGNHLSCCQRLALLQKVHASNANHVAGYGESAGVSSLNGQTSARIVTGHNSNGYSAGYTSSGHTSNGYASGGHSSGGATNTHSTGGYTSSAGGGAGLHTSGLYSSSAGGVSNGGQTSSGLTGAHTSGGLISGHTGGHSLNSLTSSHGSTEKLVSGGGFSTGHTSQSDNIGSTFTGHTAANSIRGSSGSSNGFVGGSGSGESFTPNSIGPGSSSFGGNELAGSASSGSFSSAALNGGFSAGNTALVQKHIYVHVPPHDDEEALTKAKYEALMTPKKHYKIIFIKAPTPPIFPTAQLIANAGVQEEKTLVYVLVRKPEEPAVADIKAAQAAIQPNKPEVYFIKYNTRESQPSVGGLADGSFSGSDLSSYSVANNQAFAYNSGSADSVSFTTEIPPGSYGAPPPSTVYGTK